MSTDIATLGIRVDSSSVRNANGELKILVEVGTKAEKATDGLADSFGGLKTAIAGLGLGALVKQGIDLADTYANVQGRLRLVTSGTQELAYVSDKLFESAQRARASFEATSDLYSSLARSTKSLGTSQTDLLQVTETINKALIVSGASAATAEGALTQLGQGFASGALRGDELNSVLEATPRLAQAIADGMGVTVGKLRSLGAEGKITGQTVFNALKSQKDAVEKEFAQMPTTVAQSFVVLQNEVLKYIGQANESSGATATLSAAIIALSQNLDTVVTVIEGLVVLVGSRYVASMVAASASSLATSNVIFALQARAAGAATTMEALAFAGRSAGASLLAAFGGPLGVAIAAVTGGIIYFGTEIAKNHQLVDRINKTYDEMTTKLLNSVSASNGASSGTANVGSAAKAAIPGISNLSGSLQGLIGKYWQTADAAKRARIEMASTALQSAKNDLASAEKMTVAGQQRAQANNRAALRNLDFLALDWSPVTANLDNVLSNGRTNREANGVRDRAAFAVAQRERELREAAESPNSPAVKPTATATGDSKKKSGKSDAQREYESSVEASKAYVSQLKEETATLNMSAIAQKLYEARIAAGKAPTKELASEILNSANAWVKQTLAVEHNNKIKEVWLAQQQKEKEALKSASEYAAALEFETKLQSMNAQQRAIAITQRDLETRGIIKGTEAYAKYGQTILNASSAKGGLELASDNASEFADRMRAVNDNTRAAAQSFGELFGTAGGGFADLLVAITDYSEGAADAEARLADVRARYGKDSIEAMREEAMQRRQAGNAEMELYGNVIGGVKNMFNQKSRAYKTMEAIEKTYAAVRMAIAIKEILTEGLLTTTKVAGAGTRMATDAAETASSVSKSGIRAAADGVAAFAKTLASLPFPFNLAAGAAVLAALVAVGVKISGGGGKKASAAVEKEEVKPTDYASQNSQYSVLGPTKGYSSGSASSTGGSGFSNDNGAAKAASQNVNMTWQIDARGADDPQAVEDRVNNVMQNYQADTIKKAREAVRNDQINQSNRQQIGGAR